jgi:hypothetical protein
MLNTGRVLLALPLAFLIIVSGLAVSIVPSKADVGGTYPTSGAGYGMKITYSVSGVTLGPYDDEYRDLQYPQQYGPEGGTNWRECAVYFAPGSTLTVSGNFHKDNVGSWIEGAHGCVRYWALTPTDDYRTSPNYHILDWWFSPNSSSWSSWDQPFSFSIVIPADAAYVGFDLFMTTTSPVEYQSPGSGQAITRIYPHSDYTSSGINLLIVPVSLQDQTITYSLTYYQKLAQKLVAYYDAVSYGHLKINVQVYQNGNDWVKLPKTSNDYNNVLYYDPANTFYPDAINAIDAFVNFKNYDYSADNGKGIIALITPNNIFQDGCFCFSHEQDPHFNTNDNTKIDVIYAFEDRFEGANASIRALAHEFAHALGRILVTSVQQGAKWGRWELPDEYTMGNIQATYSLMGNFKPGVERINLDSCTKEWLGWLKYNAAQINTPYIIKPLDQMQYGNNVLTYEYTKPNNEKLSYIFEARSNISTIWDNETVWNKALNIYCLEDAPNAPAQHSINLAKTLLLNDDNFTDPNVGIVVKLNSFSGQDANITIYGYNLLNSVGAVMSSMGKVLAGASEMILPDKGFSFLPDLDLHAYADDGRHVGMNYQTGVYENQIDGATASGDLTGGTEWIFVPSNVHVRFVTDSSDTAKFFQQYPDASSYSDGSETSTINFVYYSPKGSRYESQPEEQEISSGSTRTQNYTIAQNNDGSYSVKTIATSSPSTSPTPLADYWITLSPGPGGTISGHSGFTSPGSESYTYTITPDFGYQILDVTVNGVSQGSISTYTITNIQRNYEISATFVQTQTPTSTPTTVIVVGIVVGVAVVVGAIYGVSRARKRSKPSFTPDSTSLYPPPPP